MPQSLDEYFKNSKVTKQLPKGIIPVSRENNLFEEHRIKEAGYEEIYRLKSNGLGSFTVWQKPLSSDKLMFIENEDGFYKYGGIVKKSR